MIVTTDIKKTDLIILNLLLMPRMKSTYKSLPVTAFIIFFLLSWKRGFPDTSNEWFAFTIGSALGSVIAMLIGFVIRMISVLLMSTKKNGILGEHEYKISEAGLHEKTCANEGISRWEGIEEVRVIGCNIFFKISGYLYHIIPKRSFDSPEGFHEYAAASIKFSQNASKNNVK